MNKVKAIAFILFLFLSMWASGQIRLEGVVLDSDNLSGIPNAELYINENGYAETDSLGRFYFEVEQGSIDLICYQAGYHYVDTLIDVSDKRNPIKLILNPLSVELSELEIEAERQYIFAIRQLRDVEEMTINAGKKTEVVVLDKINGNMALNQGRQVYAQVGGLNIYEGSDGGLQLSIGGRGLDPNRTAYFNTRQNGYDISADVLGYPENYYTPPVQAVKEIQIIRGASSLQYGTQFGGLINFKLRRLPLNEKYGIRHFQTVGSYGLYDNFTQVGFNGERLSFNGFYNYKTGSGFRPHSEYEVHNAFGALSYHLSDKQKLEAEFTYYSYLAQQAGGLTDEQYEKDIRLSTRERNWFAVDWKLYSLKYSHELNPVSRFTVHLFGLSADRQALGFRGNPADINQNPITALDERDNEGQYIHERDLILGKFNNYGLEAKYIQEMDIRNKKAVFLTGIKWYDAQNSAVQGPGSTGSDANFRLMTEAFQDYPFQSDFTFPNRNLAAFAEGIIYLNARLSLTPGLRLEHIETAADGEYLQVVFDNAGNALSRKSISENRSFSRQFVLYGLGLDYDLSKDMKLYSNLSRNYRSITFSDIRIVSPSFIVDPEISDEKGYTWDIGVRGSVSGAMSYSLGSFGVLYQDRIGIIFNDRAQRVRKNIGDALTLGTELLVDMDLMKLFSVKQEKYGVQAFANVSYSYSEYLSSESQNVKGKQVEFVPAMNLKTGLSLQYENLTADLQYTYLSKQYTDAQNSQKALPGDTRSGIIGEIPAYGVLDLNVNYHWDRFKIAGGVNNLLNRHYYTRRATGYPGPGIIPSMTRNVFLSLGWNFQY